MYCKLGVAEAKDLEYSGDLSCFRLPTVFPFREKEHEGAPFGCGFQLSPDSALLAVKLRRFIGHIGDPDAGN